MMSRIQSINATGRITRAFVLCLGICLAFTSLVPVGACVGFVLVLASGQLDWPSWAILPGFALMLALAWWCVATSWFLLSGRERKTGGLMSPTALVVFGVAFLVSAAVFLWFFQSRAVMRASEMLAFGVGCLSLARARFRRTRGQGLRAIG